MDMMRDEISFSIDFSHKIHNPYFSEKEKQTCWHVFYNLKKGPVGYYRRK